jgi:hypothetical protein
MKIFISSALAIISMSAPVAATNLVVNGSFEETTATGKDYFQDKVNGWTGGANLTFIAAPGTADDGSYLSVYGPFPTTSPDGGNFILADGDPAYSGAFSQLISGLTIGASYTLDFYVAAGQQLDFTGPTTEWWKVTFGDETQLSTVYSLPEGGVGPWQKQSMQFTATATSQLLTFLAEGTPSGAPPISFLDGVSLTAAVPEPATWAMMIAGFGLIGASMRRRTVTVAMA